MSESCIHVSGAGEAHVIAGIAVEAVPIEIVVAATPRDCQARCSSAEPVRSAAGRCSRRFGNDRSCCRRVAHTDRATEVDAPARARSLDRRPTRELDELFEPIETLEVPRARLVDGWQRRRSAEGASMIAHAASSASPGLARFSENPGSQAQYTRVRSERECGPALSHPKSRGCTIASPRSVRRGCRSQALDLSPGIRHASLASPRRSMAGPRELSWLSVAFSRLAAGDKLGAPQTSFERESTRCRTAPDLGSPPTPLPMSYTRRNPSGLARR